MMCIGIAADHGGFDMKLQLLEALKATGYEVIDFGAYTLVKEDDYPDFVVPLARAVVRGEVTRGLAICGSGVGACVAANKVSGVRAALITDSFSAHQGVEDDDMNVMCLGGRVTGYALSWDLVEMFLSANFKGDERFKRRLAKVKALEKNIHRSGYTADYFKIRRSMVDIIENYGGKYEFTRAYCHGQSIGSGGQRSLGY